MSDAAASTTNSAAPTEGTPGGDSANGAPTPKDTPVQAAAKRIKADLGDGEQEYDLDLIIGNAKKGRNAAQLASAAERKAKEADAKAAAAAKREAELDGMWEKLKNPKEARKYLREKGVDVRAMSVEEINEAIEEEKQAQELSPEAKRVKELEEKLAAQEAEKKKGEEAEKKKAWQADYDKHLNELSDTFTKVLEKAGVPKASARRAFPYVAQLYALADGEGKPVDIEVAAAHVRERFSEEHDWLYRDPKSKALNVEALKARYSPEDWKAIQRAAVREYMAGKNKGGTTPPPPAAGGTTPPPPRPEGEERLVGARLFRSLEKQFGR
jgi:hypothetical protein